MKVQQSGNAWALMTDGGNPVGFYSTEQAANSAKLAADLVIKQQGEEQKAITLQKETIESRKPEGEAGHSAQVRQNPVHAHRPGVINTTSGYDTQGHKIPVVGNIGSEAQTSGQKISVWPEPPNQYEVDRVKQDYHQKFDPIIRGTEQRIEQIQSRPEIIPHLLKQGLVHSARQMAHLPKNPSPEQEK